VELVLDVDAEQLAIREILAQNSIPCASFPSS
jgi:hypothetical protein